MSRSEYWPPLPLHEWQNTYRTLHMWTQIVGKVRMALSPPLNHWWHVALYVNSRGLTTGPIPYAPGVFEIQFDFQKHEVNISTSEGPSASRPLRGESVASFHGGMFEALERLGIAVEIDLMPQEVADAVPFDRDYANCTYDAEYANRHWRILVSSGKVLQRFRAKSDRISCRRRLRTPFHSTGTTPTARTTPSTRIVIGEFSSPAARCSSGSERSSWGNAVRFTSFGAVLTWRAHAFPGGSRRRATA